MTRAIQGTRNGPRRVTRRCGTTRSRRPLCLRFPPGCARREVVLGLAGIEVAITRLRPAGWLVFGCTTKDIREEGNRRKREQEVKAAANGISREEPKKDQGCRVEAEVGTVSNY